MANKRMFSNSVICTDKFIDMPDSTKVLYFYLSMSADDDGFVSNCRSIQAMIGSKKDDLEILIAKSYVLVFEDGILVIKHWRINNYIRSDRYKKTVHQDLINCININDKGEYEVGIPESYQKDTKKLPVGIPSIDKNRLDKNRLDKNSISKTKNKKEVKHKYGSQSNVLLTAKEFDKLNTDLGNDMASEFIERLSYYLATHNKSYKNHNLVIRNWYKKSLEENKNNNYYKPKQAKPSKEIDYDSQTCEFELS